MGEANIQLQYFWVLATQQRGKAIAAEQLFWKEGIYKMYIHVFSSLWIWT